MATVTVLTADRIIQFENQDVIDGVIDEDGDLILTKRDGSTINLGNVKSHTDLSGLDQDDHPQYALSDGTRGNFATVAQGQKADAARPMIQALLEINGSDPTGVLETVIITDDGTVSDDWINRLAFQFRDDEESPVRHTSFFNEYGEFRVASARHNTTALRVFVKEFPDNPVEPRSATVPVVELMDNRIDRNTLWALVGDGTTVVNGIRMSYVMTLAPGAPVPPDTPPNTVILRTT